MINRERCIKKLKSNQELFSQRFKVSSMKLFGSVARNEQTEKSDVDVLVDMQPNLYLQIELKQYLEDSLGCKVDVIRHHNNMDEFFLNQINHDAITIFS